MRRLIDFFDDAADLDRCLTLARAALQPAIDRADAIVDPIGRAKMSTALFVLLTIRAVEDHGLTPPTAHAVIAELLEAIKKGADGPLSLH